MSDMGAQLNIKSEDAYRLASRLAELTGESLTAVVTKALQAELERQERQRDIAARSSACWRWRREIRAHMREPVSSDTSWMYDERRIAEVIVDASALLAVVLGGAGRAVAMRQRSPLRPERACRQSPGSRPPCRLTPAATNSPVNRFDDCRAGLRHRIIPFTAEHAASCRVSGAVYMVGDHHPARLNFGDCLVYGVAKAEREPLLFKGDDFSQTDIEPALKD